MCREHSHAEQMGAVACSMQVLGVRSMQELGDYLGGQPLQLVRVRKRSVCVIDQVARL